MGLVVGTGATAQREPRYPIHVRRDDDPGLGERDQVPVDRDAVEARPDESLAHLGVARGRLGGGQRAQNIEAAACDAKAALAEECALLCVVHLHGRTIARRSDGRKSLDGLSECCNRVASTMNPCCNSIA